MTANERLQILTQLPFALVFIAVTYHAVRRPRRANIDIALFFGDIALAIAVEWIALAIAPRTSVVLTVASGSLIMALPYLLLRLVEDFARPPRWLVRVSAGGVVLAIVGLILLRAAPPPWLSLVYVAGFVALELYDSVMFAREAVHTGGVTSRRMQAVAAGSVLLGLVLVVAGIQILVPAPAQLWQALSSAFALLAGLSYFIGFAPPGWLRRTWQQPELHDFLARVTRLPRLPDIQSIIAEMEEGAAKSVGAPHAVIGLWDADAGVLRYEGHDMYSHRSDELLGGRAFSTGRPIFSANAMRDDPEHASIYERSGAHAVLAAPITAGQNRLGALSIFAPRAPIFADDDLELVEILANQIALVLESRMLLEESARLRAREETARLKEDFLSSAAHDLKTPLTTLMAQAQLLERRAARQPEAPADLGGIQRVIREAKRLDRLVLDLMEASRLEQRALVGNREPVDLVLLAEETCADQITERHHCLVSAEGPVIGRYDRIRMRQVIENLVENSVKYSPEGGDVAVAVWAVDGEAHLTVTDHGIGIPAADLPSIFSRFHRGSNVDDRRFAGMGLGLFLCRQIVEQHGGRIWATSRAGEGSTFHVALPVADGGQPDEPSADSGR